MGYPGFDPLGFSKGNFKELATKEIILLQKEAELLVSRSGRGGGGGNKERLFLLTVCWGAGCV